MFVSSGVALVAFDRAVDAFAGVSVRVNVSGEFVTWAGALSQGLQVGLVLAGLDPGDPWFVVGGVDPLIVASVGGGRFIGGASGVVLAGP